MFQLDATLLSRCYNTKAPCVYWIRLNTHTDVFKQGYVGVSKNPLTRFTNHYRNYKHGRKNVGATQLYNAIRKHGEENIVVEILLFSDYEYCLEVEKKLRPAWYIGWNTAAGGANPQKYRKPASTRRGCSVVTEETKRRMSDSAKRRYTYSKHPMCGRTNSSVKMLEAAASRRGKCYFEFPWESHSCNKSIWAMADSLYEKWKELGCGYKTLGKHFGIGKCHSTYLMVKLFREGFIPQDNPSWLNFKQEYESGSKTET